jgi:hypothetical protein
LSIFEEVDELEFVLTGLPLIDVNEWKEYTIYRDDFNVNHEVIQWFWEVLSDLSQD